MENIRHSIVSFFDAYEARFNEALAGNEVNIDGAVNAFANCFVVASPKGVICSNNDEQLRSGIPKEYDFYKSIGTISMKIAGTEISLLGDLHAMVKIQWQSTYRKQDDSITEITVDAFYLLQLINSDIKIFAYITGDEQEVLKQHGLV